MDILYLHTPGGVILTCFIYSLVLGSSPRSFSDLDLKRINLYVLIYIIVEERKKSPRG